MVRFACVVLVNADGWLLMQERDEHATIAPDRWGLPGGHVEPGEEFLAAAIRELKEETALRLPPEALTLVGEYDVFHVETGSHDRMAMYVAEADLSDADVECHEGRRIVFVDPTLVPGLPLTDSARQTLVPFLASDRFPRSRSAERS
ncbi:MAG: NUDIX hydrolase [Nocardioides sp.]|uniref:NUDIX domain-containing protein n=1 Tax=Nocardioides sp. TaxID=35761 RepID=UPI0039E467A8